jgi:hypothetical protein
MLTYGPVSADSFMTSVSTGSKTANRVAPKPYTGNAVSPRMAKGVAGRALSTIKHTKNIAIGMEVIRRVDSVAMDHPGVGNKFRLGMAKLARTGNPKFQLLRGMNLVMRNPDSRRGAAAVRKAAKGALAGNSAAQLAAGLTVAQRDAFSPKFGHKWEKKTRLKKEAASYINKAQALEAQTKHPRPLVREGIKQAKEYAGYYEGYNGLIK